MKYIIIGAVAGGASAAARLRRLDESAEIILFEKGAYVSFANCGLPYYVGSVISDRNRLFVQTPSSLNERYRLDVRIQTEVLSINTQKKEVWVRNLLTGREYAEAYDKLVLSPGAEPVRPPLPGIQHDRIFTLRTIHDSDRIRQFVDEKAIRKIVIIGAGFIGLEMAENFHRMGKAVTIVEMSDQILAPVDYPVAAIVQQHIRSKNVKLLLKTSVAGFEEEQDGVRVLFQSGSHEFADLVLLSIGVRADTGLAIAAGLKIGARGGISVNSFLQTSNPDIYAVGDAIEFLNPLTGFSMPTFLAGPANKQGRICADNIVLGNKREYNGSFNTAIVKIFDLTVGVTGVAAKQLQAAKVSHRISTTTSSSHASYYPGHSNLIIQLVFNPENGRILGAQSVGADGVDKRIDVLSSYICHGKTVFDLGEFEHAYAPPFSSAKDPVNMAGFVAENILTDQLRIFYWNELDQLQTDDVLLDVRTEEEFRNGHLNHAVNIPIDHLRTKLTMIPSGRRIFVYCESGLRGYLAQRILRQRGFSQVANLSGGYRIWKVCTEESRLLNES